MGLGGAGGVGGGAAVLSCVGQLHVGDPHDASALHDAGPQAPPDFAPRHLRLGVTQGQALELHGVANHHGLHGGPDVDEHRGQGWGGGKWRQSEAKSATHLALGHEPGAPSVHVLSRAFAPEHSHLSAGSLT